MAVADAAGPYVCEWDAQALHDPRRLELQLLCLQQLEAAACVLIHSLIWLPGSRRFELSSARQDGRTLLCERSALDLAGGAFGSEPASGSPGEFAVAWLRRTAPVAKLDAPRLHVYVDRGAPAIGPADGGSADRFGSGRPGVSGPFTGRRYHALLAELSKRVPTAALLALDAGSAGATPDALAAEPATADAAAPEPLSLAPALPGVNLVGHLSATVGFGASARGTIAALAAAGVPSMLTALPLEDPFPVALAPSPVGAPIGGGSIEAYPVTIVQTNPDLLMRPGVSSSSRSLLPPFRSGRFNIGYWAWETEQGIPEDWCRAFAWFDEIWVPSGFAAAAIAAQSMVPVIVMPHAIQPPLPTLDRRALNLPSDAFLFLFMFDATSNVTRKNPGGLIGAFRMAFPQPAGDIRLIVKAKSLAPEALADLQQLADGRSDITIINEPYPSERAEALIAACDCYVSLHRAEGFGLSLAEAMYYGKPVIATAYSGNMEYMTLTNSFPVRFRMTELRQDDGYYTEGTVWADPDLGHAAGLMRQAVAQRDEASARGARAALWVRRRLSPAVIGGRMRRRLLWLARAGCLGEWGP